MKIKSCPRGSPRVRFDARPRIEIRDKRIDRRRGGGGGGERNNLSDSFCTRAARTIIIIAPHPSLSIGKMIKPGLENASRRR